MIFNVKSLLTFAILVLALGLSYLLFFQHKLQVISNLMKLVMLFFILFLFIGTCSVLWDNSHIHPHTSFVRLFRNYGSSIIIIFAFYISSLFFIKKGKFSSLLRILLFFFLFTTLFTAIAQQIGLIKIYSNVSGGIGTGGRQAGFFGNPNEAGAFANYTLVMLLSSFLYFKKGKIFILLVIPLALYSVFVSFSKAAMLISILILFFFLLFSIRNIVKVGKKNRKSIFLFFILLFIIATKIVTHFNSVYEDLSQGQQKRMLTFMALAQGNIDEKTTSGRNILFEHGWEKIKVAPIFGNGLGSFHRLNSGPIHLGIHNTYLMVIGESGIIPISIFLIIGFLMFFIAFRVQNPAIRFFIFGFMIVFFINVAATGHNALYDRISNSLWGITIGILANTKRL